MDAIKLSIESEGELLCSLLLVAEEADLATGRRCSLPEAGPPAWSASPGARAQPSAGAAPSGVTGRVPRADNDSKGSGDGGGWPLAPPPPRRSNPGLQARQGWFRGRGFQLVSNTHQVV